MAINWWTIALQSINFLVLVWLLQHFLYKPVLAVIARRKQLVEQAFVDAENAKQAANAEQQRLEQSQVELVQARHDLLKQTHTELEAEKNRILDAARSEAAAMLDAARARVEGEQAVVLDNVRAEVTDLAIVMSSRLLQQFVAQVSEGSQLSAGFLEQLSRRLEQLPDEERQAMSRELNIAPEGLRVVTANALTEQQQQLWREKLEMNLGTLQKLEFDVDPALIGGAELRFPHAVLSLAWSEMLQQGKRTLIESEINH
jgi:F-type H+-transporting ATPase subunit b